MTEPPGALRLGTRSSTLARWQTDHVAMLLSAAWPGLLCEVVVVQTQGDHILDTPLPLIGAKGVFTAELEAALRSKRIDMAVHSLKDLPMEIPAGLLLGAVPQRAAATDVLISRAGYSLDTLPSGAVVGTSSRRRAAQLRYHRPDLHILDLRGNIDTRLRKALAADGPYDAIALASAGLERLGRLDTVSQVLPLDVMLPAPGQGALAIECRDEADLRTLLAPLNHMPARQAVDAERAFLLALGGGCNVPIGAYGDVRDGTLSLTGRISAPDGSRQVDVRISGPATQALLLGEHLAKMALAEGAAELLAAAQAGGM